MTPPENTIITVTEEENGNRLDKLLSKRFPDQSRSYFQYLLESKLILLNGKPAKKRTLAKVNDEIDISFALTPEIKLTPEDIPLDILYEDEHLLAVNKEVGLVIHPAPGNWTGTFVNALVYHCKMDVPAQDTLRPGIVHRLDKDTTGVLIAAKTTQAQQKLVEMFSSKEMQKEYIAICIGSPGDVEIEGPIGRHPKKRKEMTIIETGKPAFTHCKTLAKNERFSLVRLTPETGRTHQLRVHLQHQGHPILGDPVYGSQDVNKRQGIRQQMLHAHRLQFTHPITGEKMDIRAPIHETMLKFIHSIVPPDVQLEKEFDLCVSSSKE